MDFYAVMLGDYIIIKRSQERLRVSGKSIEADESGRIIKLKILTNKGEFSPTELEYDIRRPNCIK